MQHLFNAKALRRGDAERQRHRQRSADIPVRQTRPSAVSGPVSLALKSLTFRTSSACLDYPERMGGPVAQISPDESGLYRGFPTCRVLGDYQRAGKSERLADWKSAIQQVGNLRYDPAASSASEIRRSKLRTRMSALLCFPPFASLRLCVFPLAPETASRRHTNSCLSQRSERTNQQLDR